MPNGDMMGIRKQNGASGMTEVHILSKASNYQEFAVYKHTPLNATNSDWDFEFISDSELMCIQKQNTGSDMTEVIF